MAWDMKRPSGAVWAMMNADNRIIWGGNYFADQLPPARGWLVWDKKQRGTWTTGHTELAWTDIDQPIRAYSLSQVEAHTGMDKQHSAQKPIQIDAVVRRLCPRRPNHPRSLHGQRHHGRRLREAWPQVYRDRT
jgi:hypothetical protein